MQIQMKKKIIYVLYYFSVKYCNFYKIHRSRFSGMQSQSLFVALRMYLTASTLSVQAYIQQEDFTGTSFTCILHPLKFRLSAEDYSKYYFAGGLNARE